MRVLNFDTPQTEEHYKMISEGLAMTQKQMSSKEVRRFDKIVTQLETIGKRIEGENKFNFYELRSVPATLELEDADYDLLKSVLEPPNVAWNGFGQRKAGKMLLWLDAAPEKETKPKLVE